MKLLLIGFDGLDYKMAKAMSPKFRVLQTQSPEPIFTGPCWTSIYTGWEPSHHGVLEYWGRAEGKGFDTNTREDMRGCIDIDHSAAIPFWYFLMGAGISCGLMNLPCAGVPDPLFVARGYRNYWMPGFPEIVEHKGMPVGIFDLLMTDYPRICDWHLWHKGFDSYPNWRDPALSWSLDDSFDMAEADTYRLCTQFIHFEHKWPSDFGAIQFSFLDRLAHRFSINGSTSPRFMNIVHRTIELLDTAITPQSLMIVSDHGFEENHHAPCGALAYIHKEQTRQEISVQEPVSLTSIAPTILAIFGLSWPEGHPRDGDPLYYTESLSSYSEVAPDFLLRMRSLGYLDN